MRRLVFAALAGSLAVIGLAGLGLYIWERPTVLRVAVTRNSDSNKVLAAMQQAFARESKNIRFKIIPVQDFAASAAALEANASDLSVVRSDIALPPIGQTLAIFYREAAVLMAPAGSRLGKVSSLNGQRVGVLRGNTSGSGNTNLLTIVLGQYDVPQSGVTIRALLPEELPKAIREHEIDAVMVVGVPSGGVMQDAVTALTQNGNGPPVFIPISEASAISQRSPIFESREIVAGTFGGSPQRPVESFDTLGVTVRLVARSSLADSVAADVVRHIFAVRPMIAVSLPIANQLEAPSTDKGQTLPTHPGAAAFFDGEEQTFLEKNSDFIYLGALLASLVGSGLAALASRIGMQGHAEIEAHLERLLHLMQAARNAGDTGTLDQIDDEAHIILASALERTKLRGFDSGRASAFTLAFDRVCATVRDRRMHLAAGQDKATVWHP